MSAQAKPSAAAPMYRIHPRITLEVCHQCLGRAFLLAVRNGKVIRERCTNCAGSGSIARDDGAGEFDA